MHAFGMREGARLLGERVHTAGPEAGSDPMTSEPGGVSANRLAAES